MAKRFNIDIILNLLTEGKSEFSEIEKQAASIRKQLSSVSNQYTKALDVIVEGTNDAAKGVRKLSSETKNLRRSLPEKLIDTSELKKSIEDVELLISRLDALKATANKSTPKNIQVEIDRIEKSAQPLRDTLDLINKVNQEEIAPQISKELKSELTKINNTFKGLGQTVNDTRKELQTPSKTQIIDTSKVESDKKKTTELLKTLETAKKKQEDLGEFADPEITTGLQKAIKVVKSYDTQLGNLITRVNEVNRLQILPEIKGNFQKEVNDIRRDVGALARDIKKAEESGTSFNRNLELGGRAADLQQKIENLKKSGQDFGFDTTSIVALEKTLDTATDSLVKSVAELKNQDEAVRQSKLDNNLLADSYKNLSKSVTELNSEINKSSTRGSLTEDAPEYRNRINDLRVSLTDLRKEFLKANLEVTGIDAALLKINQYDNSLNKTTDELQELDAQVRKTRLDDLVNEAAAVQEFKKIEREIAELIKLIDEAKAKGKTISIVTEFKEKIQKTGDKLDTFAQGNKNDSLLKGVARGRAVLNNASAEIQSIESALPKSTLGKVFTELGEKIRLVGKAASAEQGVFKAFSTGLRLIGTTAFVVGGELRVAGFAFSALGSIMQNFAPVVLRVLQAAGPLAPVVIGLGVAAVAAATQLAIFVGAMSFVITEGLKFNSAVEVATNNIAGLINEYFNLNAAFKSGTIITDEMKNMSQESRNFLAAQELASEALNQLELDALVTNFTFQELLKPFQATVTVLGSLGKDLLKTEELAIGFARVGTLVGYGSDQVATSISEILSGVGRSTNAIQRQLNRITDSSGLRLTRERIRELKAENPDKFVDEITNALNRLTAQAALANFETLPGVISNFRDLFGTFSRKATLPALDTLKKTLNSIYKDFVPIDDILNKRTKSALTEEVQKLLEFVREIASLFIRDIAGILQKIAKYVLSLGQYFKDNRDSIIELYNAFKVTLKTVGLLIYDFLKIFGIVGDTKNEFILIKSLLGTIVVIANTVRLVFIGVGGTLDLIGLALNGILLLIYKVSKAIYSLAPKSVRDYLLPGIEANIKEKEKQIDRFLGNLDESNKEIVGIFKSGSEFFSSDGLSIKEKAKLTDPNLSDKDEPDKVKKVGKAVIKSYLEYYDAIVELAKNRNQLYLTEVDERISGELKLYEKLEQQGIKSISDFNDQTAKLEKERITSQLKTLDEDEKIIKSKLDSFENGRKKVGIINAAYQAEVARVTAEFDQKGETEGEDRSAELASRLADLNNKRNKDLLAIQKELEDLDSRRKVLRASVLQIDVDLAGKELERVAQIRKDLASLRLDIAEQASYSPKFIDKASIIKDIEDIIEPFRKNRVEIEYLLTKVSELQDLLQKDKGNPVLEARLSLYKEQINSLSAINQYTLEKIAIDQRARELARVDQNVQLLQNGLRREEDEINLKVTRGIISQQEAIIETTVARKQYVNAIKEQIAELNKAAAERPLDKQEIDRLRDLEQQIKSINTTITESVLLNFNQEIGTGLIDFLEKVQENVGNTSSALKDLGNVFLKAFRRTVAQQIVQEFFTPLLGQLGQTEGKAKGFVAGLLRNLGLEPAVKQQAEVDATTGKTENNKIGGLDLIISQKIGTLENIVNAVVAQTEKRLEQDNVYLSNFQSKVTTAADGLKLLGDISIGLYSALKDSLNFILQNGGKLNDKSLQEKLKSTPKTTTKEFPSIFGNKEVPLTDKITGIINPEIPQTFVSGAFQTTIASLKETLGNITTPFVNAFYLQRDLGSQNTRALEISATETSVLTNALGNLSSIIESLIGQLSSGVASNSSGQGNGNKLTGLFNTLTGVIDAFKNNGKAAGGYISGAGGRIQDMVPAMLSNGEYVINATTVQKYGKSFFDNINKRFAAGGFVLPDPTKYNYAGGGASLINKPTPISVDFAALQAAANPKKKGLFSRIFGGALSFAAPFLNLIPGVGPFLSIAAGAAGGALSGTDKKSSILGGILGGLGNFGGFAGKGGKLGGIADFLKKSKVQDVLGIFGGALNNGASTLGYFGNSIFEKYFAKYTKKAMGGLIRRPKKYLFGGLVSGLSGLFSKFGGLFGKGSSAGHSIGGNLASSGGGGFLSKLFGGSNSGGGLGQLLGLFGGLFGGGGSQSKPDDFDTVNPSGFEGSADPDYLRKNKYGSAYNFLTETGAISAFNYTKEILDFIDSVYSGNGEKSSTNKSSGFLGNILGFVTTAASIFGLLKKSGAPANSFNSAGFKNLKNQFLSGNFVQRALGGVVEGVGSGTSDSIPAMLSNGEYVIRAAAVKNIGTNVLDYINSGRVKLAAGGLVGDGLNSIGSNANSSNGVNVDARTKIINVLDPNLLQEYMNTSDGRRTLVNLISNNKSMFRDALGVR